MKREIFLTGEEKALRQFLSDVSDYIGAQDGYTRPELRFTGGWVRDKLLGIQSNDIDIGISTMTGYYFGKFMKQYRDDREGQAKYGHLSLGHLAKIEANPEKSKHLETLTTKMLGFDLDFVNLRKETYVENSRNPAMEFGSPQDDALRRDATVNAIFYNIDTGEVEDLTEHGLADMEKKIIRTPLNPDKTFEDDPLRILRCIRFASKLGYCIDASAEKSMSKQSIQKTFKAKITRERVGVEIEKMMKGSNPYSALSFIDRLGLYNTVFTDPTESVNVSTEGWARAYEGLREVLHSTNRGSEGSKEFQLISTILLRNKEDIYRAWILCAFVPWTRIPLQTGQDSGNRMAPSAAARVARNGLKADNKLCKVIEDAVYRMDEISTSKDRCDNSVELSGSPLKRKQKPISRGKAAMSVYTWGSNWRCSVIFALLTQFMNSETEGDSQNAVKQYAAWLSHLRDLDVLDAYTIKPTVNGNRLMKALGTKGGKWMTFAKIMALEWQFEHPEDTDGNGAIEEVIRCKNKLDLFS